MFLFLFILLQLSQFSPLFVLFHPAHPSHPQSIPTPLSVGRSYMFSDWSLPLLPTFPAGNDGCLPPAPPASVLGPDPCSACSAPARAVSTDTQLQVFAPRPLPLRLGYGSDSAVLVEDFRGWDFTWWPLFSKATLTP